VILSKTFPFSFRWYFGKIKRMEAEKKLLLPQNEHGAFLIRDSESRRNDYSLSIRDGDTVKVENLFLTLRANKLERLNAGRYSQH
jgi:hypothetical protein